MVEQNEPLDAVFRALGDPNRIWIMQQLSRRERSISDLAEPLDMTLAGVSKHIGVLEKAGLLTRQKRGRERVCTLRPSGLIAAQKWIQHYAKFWDERLDALDQAMKEEGNG